MQAYRPTSAFDNAVEKVQEIIQELSEGRCSTSDTVRSLCEVMRVFQTQMLVATPNVLGISGTVVDDLRMSPKNVGGLERDVQYAMSRLREMVWEDDDLDTLARLLCEKYSVPAIYTPLW